MVIGVLQAFAEKSFGGFAFIIPLAVVLATFSCAMSVQFGVTRFARIIALNETIFNEN